MTEPSFERCCCGWLYSARGGHSSHYCPTGERQLCEECASAGQNECPTHKVPIKF